jgi:hypothetical protein
MVTDIQQLEGAARMAMANFDFDQSDDAPTATRWVVALGFSAAFIASSGFVALLFL